ncbi:MAG: GAF domain-containing sensor histidine kinase, partial [Nitrospirales bacterium]
FRVWSKLVRIVCEKLNFDLAFMWLVDKRKPELHCISGWSKQGGTLGDLGEGMRRLQLGKGVGFPGRVLACGYPIWVSDHDQASAWLTELPLSEVPIRSWVGFPIHSEKGTLGIVEAYSSTPPPKDNEWIVALDGIGAQVGQFVSQRQDCTQNLDAEVWAQSVSDTCEQVSPHRTEWSLLDQISLCLVHDFNNTLMSIRGFSELLHERLGRNTPQAVFVEEIRRASMHGVALTSQLLAHARQGPTETEHQELDLNATISELKNLLSCLMGKHIKLVMSLLPTPSLIKGNHFQLARVLINLAVNAKAAMPKGGRLTIETSYKNFREGATYAEATLPPGRYVQLKVQDSGCGMDPATLGRLFEPFFTTKKESRGTGLGLTIVNHIVHRHGGLILVESKVGVGTSFMLYLPSSIKAGLELSPPLNCKR